MQALLNTLFTIEERRMILEEAKKGIGTKTFARKSWHSFASENWKSRGNECFPVKMKNRIKLQASLLATALNGNSMTGKGRRKIGMRGDTSRGRGSPRGVVDDKLPLSPNQCAYCKWEGHWKKACPELKKKEPNEETNLIMLEDSDWGGPGENTTVSPANPLVPVKLGN